MSTQLVFWRTAQRLDPRAVYQRLIDADSEIEGLDLLDLPAIEAAVLSAFRDWTVDASRDSTGGVQTMLSAPGGQGAFDIEYSPRSVICTCYGLDGPTMNRFMDVMFTFDLPLYDPQIEERFDQTAP